MCGLTAVLAVATAAIAVVLGSHNVIAVAGDLSLLPPYIWAVTLLILWCAGCLAFSAWRWRRRRILSGSLSLAAAVVVFVAGPRLLLPLTWW